MDWQTFGFFATLLAAWSALLVNLQKSQLDRLGHHLDKRLDELKSTQDKHVADLAALKAELPRDYIRREDWVRQVTVFDAKIDGWVGRFEANFEKMRNYLYERKH